MVGDVCRRGVIERSKVGPLLWNTMYDSFLEMERTVDISNFVSIVVLS